MAENLDPTLWCSVVCESVEDLLSFLRPTHEIWGRRGDQWIYRGQSNADWLLVPSAFRVGPDGAGPKFPFGTGVDPPKSFIDMISAESTALTQFFLCADAIGLPVPGDGPHVRNTRQLFGKIVTKEIAEFWPPREWLELIAIAQHHGVPTRLLDFTDSALVAAFFACWPLARKRGRTHIEQAPDRFAIWALHRCVTNLFKVKSTVSPEAYTVEEVQAIMSNPTPEAIDALIEASTHEPDPARLEQIRVPRAANAFLRAQEGLFLIDHWTNATLLEEGRVKPFEIVALMEAMNSHSWDDLDHPGYVVVKLEVPSHLSIDVLQALRIERVTQASLMPTYDNVVAQLFWETAQGIEF